MSRNKLKKFAELDKLSNVAQESQVDCKNKLKGFSKGEQDLILELGCGKGEYTLAMAILFPDKKFIGVDIQGERIWHGAKQSIKEKLNNVFFLRTQIESLSEYFDKASISEIWITFPDPFPRDSQIKKRLTSPRFLKDYKKILKPISFINLKTDDKPYYDYSLETIKEFGGKIIENISDIYKNELQNELLSTKTFYEIKHLANNKKIYYIRAKMK